MRRIGLPAKAGKEARDFVARVVKCLEEQGKLDSIDVVSLHMLTNACDNYLKAMDGVREHGLVMTSSQGNQSVSPYFKVARDCERTIMGILQDYGCTLKSRQRLNIMDGEVGESPLDKFMSESKRK